MNEDAAHGLWVRDRGKRAHLPFASRASQSIEPEGAFYEHGPLDVARRCEQLPVEQPPPVQDRGVSHIAPALWLARHLRGAEPVVRSDSLLRQFAPVAAGAGVALVPAPSVERHGLVPVKLGAALRPDAALLPVDELFLVTHRALREVPRVRVVWDLLLARAGDRARQGRRQAAS
ncbi:hypothetical protein [Sorangium sp. So ce128]|uniref:hypothetical protein n=1 Tax=Sorangium sp. So ce128 TaxID=3133281 RepID=UPI003F5E08A5